MSSSKDEILSRQKCVNSKRYFMVIISEMISSRDQVSLVKTNLFTSSTISSNYLKKAIITRIFNCYVSYLVYLLHLNSFFLFLRSSIVADKVEQMLHWFLYLFNQFFNKYTCSAPLAFKSQRLGLRVRSVV